MRAHYAIRKAAHDALCGLRIPHADHVWASPIPFFDEVADAIEAALSAAGYAITAASQAKRCHRCGFPLRVEDTYTRLDGTAYHLRGCPETVDAADEGATPAIDRVRIALLTLVSNLRKDAENHGADIRHPRVVLENRANDAYRIVEVLDALGEPR